MRERVCTMCPPQVMECAHFEGRAVLLLSDTYMRAYYDDETVRRHQRICNPAPFAPWGVVYTYTPLPSLGVVRECGMYHARIPFIDSCAYDDETSARAGFQRFVERMMDEACAEEAPAI